MTKEQQREKLTKMTAAELNAVVAQTATDDYKEPPVDIETFLDDPYFLGDFFGGKLREVVRECLQDIFPSPYTNRYWLVALKGCKGWGKTWAAGAGLLYSAHKFLCMRDPQGFFGLGPETMLVFYIFNVTLSNSKTNKIDVVWDTIFRMIQTSPYFRNKMSEVKMSGDKLERAIFPNRIDFHAGSRVVHALGQAVACLTADTRIPLLDGREVAVGDLVKGLSTEEDIWVHSWDLDRKALVPGKVIAACRSGFRPVWRVYLDNEKYFDATDNHRMLMRSGEYLTVGDLRVGDAFLPFNLKVVNIEYLGVVPVYDIQIDNYQNFALSCGIISHNSAILDEANFEVIGGQVYQNFSELLRRMQTRFIKGTVWVVSSEQEKTSVLNSIIKRYEGQRGVKVVGHSIWEAVPSKFSGETFEMFPGSDTRPAFIVGEDNIEIPEEDKSRIIYVPVEYKGLAQADLGGFLRDMAGMETASKDRLFRQKDKLDAAMVLDPLFPDVIQLSFADVEDRIEDHMVRETPGYFGSIPFRGCPRYLHIDFGITGDRLGMAAVYSSGTIERTSGSNIPSLLSEIDKTTKNSFMRVPRVTVEWVLAIEAKKGFPVPLPRVSTFILWLKSMRYPITHISADGFQSAYFLQEMEMVGYKTVVISTDRTVEPYTSLREAVYDGRCALPRSNLLRKELLGLERSADGRKVDHAEDGSKDVADAVAGAAFAMLGDDKMRFIQKFAREDRAEERKETSSEGLKELFWGRGSSAADHIINQFGEQDWPRK